MKLSDKGFIPLILIFLAIIVGIAGTGLLIKQNSLKNLSAPSSSPETTAISSPNPSISSKASSTTKPTPKSTLKPTITPTLTPKPNSTATPKPTNTPTPQPTATPQPKVTCLVQFIPDTGTAPVEIQLIYGATYGGGSNNYVTNVQWDWDGDGNWDTNLSTDNQHLTHTYDKPGTFQVKMHLQTNDGAMSDICSNTLIIK